MLIAAARWRNQPLFICAMAPLLLAVVRLAFVDTYTTATILFNQRFGMYLLAIAVVVILYEISRRAGHARLTSVASIAINALALAALTLEANDFFDRRLRGIHPAAEYHDLITARDFSFSALWMAYGAVLMAIGFTRRSSLLRWQALIVIAATVVKVFAYDVWGLDRVYRILSFIVLGVLLLAISFAYQRDWLRLRESSPQT
jgi:uncharacterized membrane protein